MDQPPGGIPGRLPVDLRPRRSILLPYNDLLIDQGLDQFLPILPGGFQLGIVLPYAMGPTEPKVLQTDAAGALQVTTLGATGISSFNAAQWAGVNLGAPFVSGDAMAAQTAPFVIAEHILFNGATWERSRSASAATLAAQSGLGVSAVSGPGEWVASNAPAAGVAASAVRAAGAAGVRHIGQSITFTMASQAAIAASTVTLNIRDGAAGAGIILEQYNFDLPAAIVAPFALILTDLNLVGTAATAMTAEMGAAIAGLRGSVTVRGYDAA